MGVGLMPCGIFFITAGVQHFDDPFVLVDKHNGNPIPVKRQYPQMALGLFFVAGGIYYLRTK